MTSQADYRNIENLAHDFMIFHMVFDFCSLNVLQTLITENYENIYIVNIKREKKS